jgi:GAF domain-containing protein
MKPEQQIDTPAIQTHRLLFNPTVEGLPSEFPFRMVCLLLPLIEEWRRKASENPKRYGTFVDAIETQLAKTPALAKPIKDLSLLRNNPEAIEMLLRPQDPLQEWAKELRALTEPLGMYFHYGTPRMEEMLQFGKDELFMHRLGSTTLYTRILYAYKAILHKYYDFVMQVDQPVILVMPDITKQMDRYFKLNASSQYISIHNRKPVPELKPAELDYLLQNVDDIACWMKRIPPDHFEFVGFSVVTLVDVTNEVATASLKDILLTSDANVTEENFDLVQREVRTLFRMPHLQLGLASIQGNRELNFSSERKIWNSLQIRDAMREGALDLHDSFYEQVLQEGRPITIKDLNELPSETAVKTRLLEQGVRSILLAPLRYKGHMVGLLELSSSQPGDLHALALLKLKQIESIFALAIHQNLEQFENQIESVIQETYTAIHPTVAWRFREAAITMLERQKHQDLSQAEPIVFPELYPLYGSADIRGSSQHRNEAVRTDLIEHLELARTTLTTTRSSVPLTLILELNHRINSRIEQLRERWSTGDESDIADFLKGEINPLLNLLAQEHPVLLPAIETYYAQTSLDSGLLTKRRRAYEASLHRINDVISEVLEKDQPELQQVFPHYFEKYKTDGIEHTMYLGSSLVPDRTFDLAYVRNLRLRQLIMCCEIARQVHRLKRRLEVPLEVTQLVLVQDVPLTIRFRLEEKKFDVDGSYSVRYEIMKKRIDKAYLKESDERVTQPNRIAIIYSLDKEANEYLRYIDFLQANGELKEETEQLELKDLPGVSGLKALRVEVNLHAPKKRQKVKDIMKAAERIIAT